MSEALNQLLDILKLEKIDTNLYRGVTPKTTSKRAVSYTHLTLPTIYSV